MPVGFEEALRNRAVPGNRPVHLEPEAGHIPQVSTGLDLPGSLGLGRGQLGLVKVGRMA